jgi:hypothetical protein
MRVRREAASEALTGVWTKHGRSQRWAGEPPQSFVRFYFASEADAEAFRRRWLSD